MELRGNKRSSYMKKYIRGGDLVVFKRPHWEGWKSPGDNLTFYTFLRWCCNSPVTKLLVKNIAWKLQNVSASFSKCPEIIHFEMQLRGFWTPWRDYCATLSQRQLSKLLHVVEKYRPVLNCQVWACFQLSVVGLFSTVRFMLGKSLFSVCGLKTSELICRSKHVGSNVVSMALFFSQEMLKQILR